MSRVIVPTNQLQSSDRNNKPHLEKNSNLESAESWVNSFLGSKLEIEEGDIKEVGRNFNSTFTHSGLIYFLHLAWAKEKAIEFRPDMVWHTVINEFASMVLKYPQIFRSLFTNSSDKTDLVINSIDRILDVNILIEELRKKIASKDFLSAICDVEFESAPKEAKYASSMIFACAATPFFNYGTTRCGIPAIEVVGSLDDWHNLANAVDTLASFIPLRTALNKSELGSAYGKTNAITKKLRQYFTVVKSLCEKFILHHGDNGKKASSFYSDIFHYGPNIKCASGHKSNLVKGWARNLYLESCNENEKDIDDFPGHVAYVPYTIKETLEVYVQASALSHSTKLDNDTLSPQYGIITFRVNNVSVANKLINPDGKELSTQLQYKILTEGKSYKPATSHYPERENIKVSCDRCKKDGLEECIGYLEYDICLDCVPKLTLECENASGKKIPFEDKTENPVDGKVSNWVQLVKD